MQRLACSSQSCLLAQRSKIYNGRKAAVKLSKASLIISLALRKHLVNQIIFLNLITVRPGAEHTLDGSATHLAGLCIKHFSDDFNAFLTQVHFYRRACACVRSRVRACVCVVM